MFISTTHLVNKKHIMTQLFVTKFRNLDLPVDNIDGMSIGVLVQINSFGAKFQTTFIVCIFILTNCCLERLLYAKLKE